tara:strand:- start:1590 stop:1739 length:150 start_codon:yes stop_codon:yes gene_type:complete
MKKFQTHFTSPLRSCAALVDFSAHKHKERLIKEKYFLKDWAKQLQQKGS